MKNPNLTVKTVYGEIIVNKNDFIGNKIIQEGYWEIEDVRLVELILLELIKRKNSKKIYFYDIGANIGTYSLAIAKLTDDIEVISYEAQSQVFYMLCGTVALNGLRNIKCLHKAVSDIAEQTLEIRIPDYDSEGSFGSIELITPIHSDNQQFKFSSVEKISTITLDSTDGEIDFLKIDVEGMEDKVLMGGRNKIKTNRPVIFVEIYKTDQDFVKKYLTELNYTLYIDNNTFNLIALPQELGLAITNSKWQLIRP